MEVRKFWNEKRYYSLDYYLKDTFGEKVYKVSLNGGMTCPNRDGTLDSRGCIFCSAGGSGDFAAPVCESVTVQIDRAIAGIKKAKTVGDKFIAYFQSYTNTYADVEYLRKIFTEAIEHPQIVALSIGTRPDCLGEEVLALLEELNRKKPVWVEIGLQTIHERTAKFIRRGYPLSVFEKAVEDLNRIHVQVIVHVILGLPFESREDILDTIRYLSKYSKEYQLLEENRKRIEEYAQIEEHRRKEYVAEGTIKGEGVEEQLRRVQEKSCGKTETKVDDFIFYRKKCGNPEEITKYILWTKQTDEKVSKEISGQIKEEVDNSLFREEKCGKVQKPIIHGIKLQLLHVLKGTDLAKYQSYFKTLSLEEYVDLLLECIELLPQDIVIHRITGDGPKKLLLAPLWSASKKTAMNTIHKEMKLRDSWQGKRTVIK